MISFLKAAWKTLVVIAIIAMIVIPLSFVLHGWVLWITCFFVGVASEVITRRWRGW